MSERVSVIESEWGRMPRDGAWAMQKPRGVRHKATCHSAFEFSFWDWRGGACGPKRVHCEIAVIADKVRLRV